MRVISGYLWLWVLVAVFAALKLPFLFLGLKPVIKPLLAFVLLSMGLTLKPEEFSLLLKKPKLVVVGLFTQYTVMPFVGFAVAKLLYKGLPKVFTAGEVLTGSCPTGVVSNVYNFLTGANLALSLALSGVNTLVSPFLTPLLTKLLAAKVVEVNALSLFKDMVLLTLLPVTVGLAASGLFKERVERVKPVLPELSALAVVLIVGFVVAAGKDKIEALPAEGLLLLVAGVTVHLLLGFWLGYLIPRFLGIPPRERVTISIETAMQNSGLATVLAVTHWGPLAALPAVVYSVVQNLVGPFVVKLFRAIHGRHLK
ncbi:bile acid:sodium symporter family protein [Thermovibrio ammonificans]|uniref:Bile acid:sodium symporter n=1 Tax=Thermovibrio ammonificans (strain DSM 15698 / JCM 12110 / HB-1) TaxID=648996 RepID=E8T4D1_THEA1|nr:bile acid:sodium symporter family protein [Thermovibrio ammonificans]ADU96266.1 Bile acid:sodium symporter [Thermovibrio ammonificans HB-1]